MSGRRSLGRREDDGLRRSGRQGGKDCFFKCVAFPRQFEDKEVKQRSLENLATSVVNEVGREGPGGKDE